MRRDAPCDFKQPHKERAALKPYFGALEHACEYKSWTSIQKGVSRQLYKISAHLIRLTQMKGTVVFSKLPLSSGLLV